MLEGGHFCYLDEVNKTLSLIRNFVNGVFYGMGDRVCRRGGGGFIIP